MRGPTGKMAFGQRLEDGERGKSHLGNEHSRQQESVQTPETGACLVYWRHSKNTSVAGAVSKNTKRWDHRGKGGGRRDPIGPCKLLGKLWLLLDSKEGLLEGSEQHGDMMWFPFKNHLRGYSAGNRGPRVETGSVRRLVKKLFLLTS